MSDAHAEGEKKAVSGIAVVGFIAVVIIGMILAVYASRYVPQFLNSLSSAVYLSSDSANNGKATTTPTVVTPAPTTTIVPETPATVATSAPQLPNETGYTPRTYTPTRVVTTRPNLYGYADLAVSSLEVGYQSGSSFIETSRIPSGRDMVVKFTVKNVGTNIASGWRVRVRVEGQSDAIAYGGSLNPNGYQNFTLRATDLESDTYTTRIDVDYTNAVAETNESNNNDSIDARVGGSASHNNDDVSCSIDASDTRVDEGDRITLEWDTDGDVTYASINNGVGRVDEDGGTERVTVDDDTTFRLTVRNSDGDEDTCSVTVRIN